MFQQQRIFPFHVLYIVVVALATSFLSHETIITTNAFIVTNPAKCDDSKGRLFSSNINSISSSSNGIDYSFLLSNNEIAYTKEDLLEKDQIDYITELVHKRSVARNNGNYDLADSIRDKINALSEISNEKQQGFIPDGYIVEIKDIPRKEGGGSIWNLQLKQKEPIEWNDNENRDKNNRNMNEDYERDDDDDDGGGSSSVLKIAHSALGLASWSSENNVPVDIQKLNDLVIQAKLRLRKTGSKELRGRKAADAAFWFAMAGVDDEIDENCPDDLKFSLFDSLTIVCIEELQRFGYRQSCRVMDILHVVERIAAAGIKSEYSTLLQLKAAQCLLSKDLSSTKLVEKGIIDMLQKGEFELHTERSLLWIWRFSTRQRKQQAFLKSASRHWESSATQRHVADSKCNSIPSVIQQWDTVFDDPTLPLVVDVGCGMGISVLGLATTTTSADNSSLQEINGSEDISTFDFEWNNCNFLGADLSQLAINFASSISQRWKLKGRVHFEVISAEEVLENIVASYPGPVKLITIQFPTPFSFQEDKNINENNGNNLSSVAKQGNNQLPKSAFSGFMVNSRLLTLANAAVKDCSGKLLLQSNCEDVAVLMKNIAIHQANFHTLDLEEHRTNLEDKSRLTKRTEKWIAMGGERAEGSCWSSIPLLPSKGSTETEVACILNGTPIHRCLLKPNTIK